MTNLQKSDRKSVSQFIFTSGNPALSGFNHTVVRIALRRKPSTYCYTVNICLGLDKLDGFARIDRTRPMLLYASSGCKDSDAIDAFYRELILLFRGVRFMDVLIVADEGNAQPGCMRRKEGTS